MNIFEKIVASSFMTNLRDSLVYYGLRTERTTNLLRCLGACPRIANYRHISLKTHRNS